MCYFYITVHMTPMISGRAGPWGGGLPLDTAPIRHSSPLHPAPRSLGPACQKSPCASQHCGQLHPRPQQILADLMDSKPERALQLPLTC